MALGGPELYRVCVSLSTLSRTAPTLILEFRYRSPNQMNVTNHRRCQTARFRHCRTKNDCPTYLIADENRAGYWHSPKKNLMVGHPLRVLHLHPPVTAGNCCPRDREVELIQHALQVSVNRYRTRHQTNENKKR